MRGATDMADPQVEALAAALRELDDPEWGIPVDPDDLARQTLATLSQSGWSLVRTEGLEAASFLAYLWEATGKDPDLRVRDLFDDNDPIHEDVEKFAGVQP
jgi:hypothetical protein